jgi:GT2 family glycosyltransferase
MRLSVVVATCDRPAFLAPCLEALQSQTLPRDAYEVIVVDDGSREPVSVPTTSAVAIRLVRLPESRGPAGARNAGVGVARGEILAFTDDDCRPDPAWLEGGHRALEKGLDLVAGRTLPDGGEHGPFDYAMNVPGPDPRYSTCNVFYRRETFERVGGFSDAFYSRSEYHLGEDSDLAWRAIESGARAGYAADALVYHAVRVQTFRQYLRSRRRLEGLVPLVKRHPGIKQAHFARHCYSVTHLFTGLALLGVALSAFTAPALALLAPWIGWRSRNKRALVRAPGHFLRRNRALPLFFVADVYELAIFARASIRHRHLYL